MSRAIPFSLLLSAVAFAPLAFGIATIPDFEPMPAPAVASEVEVPVFEESAVDLITATHGRAAAEVRASGNEARAINASLPFASDAVEAARSIDLSRAPASDRQLALQCLTQAVYYEAGFEPVEGRRAVAQVVLNRLRHPAFPKSVCGVVYEGSTRPGCQFSFTCDGSLRRAPSAAAWDRAGQVARAALAGEVERSVGLATHYHTDWVAPYWAPKLAKVTQIGAHIFYRWPGSWGRKGAFTGSYAGGETFGAQAAAPVRMAAVAVVAPDPTERRAENDVGGRIDASKGWTLSIPVSGEAGGSLGRMVETQAKKNAATAVLALNENPGSGQ